MFRRVATIDGRVAAVLKRRYATRVIRGRLGPGLERLIITHFLQNFFHRPERDRCLADKH